MLKVKSILRELDSHNSRFIHAYRDFQSKRVVAIEREPWYACVSIGRRDFRRDIIAVLFVGRFPVQKDSVIIPYIATLRRQGYPAFIRQHQAGGATWHKVLLGPYQEHSQALLAQEKVRREMKTDAYISRVPIAIGQDGK